MTPTANQNPDFRWRSVSQECRAALVQSCLEAFPPDRQPTAFLPTNHLIYRTSHEPWDENEPDRVYCFTWATVVVYRDEGDPWGPTAAIPVDAAWLADPDLADALDTEQTAGIVPPLRWPTGDSPAPVRRHLPPFVDDIAQTVTIDQISLARLARMADWFENEVYFYRDANGIPPAWGPCLMVSQTNDDGGVAVFLSPVRAVALMTPRLLSDPVASAFTLPARLIVLAQQIGATSLVVGLTPDDEAGTLRTRSVRLAVDGRTLVVVRFDDPLVPLSQLSPRALVEMLHRWHQRPAAATLETNRAEMGPGLVRARRFADLLDQATNDELPIDDDAVPDNLAYYLVSDPATGRPASAYRIADLQCVLALADQDDRPVQFRFRRVPPSLLKGPRPAVSHEGIGTATIDDPEGDRPARWLCAYHAVQTPALDPDRVRATPGTNQAV